MWFLVYKNLEFELLSYLLEMNVHWFMTVISSSLMSMEALNPCCARVFFFFTSSCNFYLLVIIGDFCFSIPLNNGLSYWLHLVWLSSGKLGIWRLKRSGMHFVKALRYLRVRLIVFKKKMKTLRKVVSCLISFLGWGFFVLFWFVQVAE